VTDHHKTGHMCPAFARVTQLHTTLNAPLAGRQVIDGATGRKVTTSS
jgi:hypothetical protein